MSTFFSTLIFEWRYFVRQPSFIIMSSLFFLLSFLATSIEQVQVGSSANQSLHLNSPYLITQMLLIFCVFGLFLIVNFVANTALRARLSNMYELIYTKQTPIAYFLGSFFGSYVTVISVFLFVPVGISFGSLMPWLGPERLGQTHVLSYLQPFLIYVIPTLFSLCCLIYVAALKFKSMMAVYLTALVVVVLYLTLDNLLSNPDYSSIVAIFDPFALNAFANETRYWTPFERNTQIAGTSTDTLINRVLWCFIGCISLYFCRFKWSKLEREFIPSGKKNRRESYTPIIDWHSTSTSRENRIQQYLMRVLFETRLLVYSPSFILLLLFCAYLLIYQLVFPISFFDTPDLPVTYEMVRKIRESFGLIMLIIITFYSAEIVWREHNHKFQELLAVTSTPNEVFWFAKLTALCLLGGLVYIMGMLITIIHQLADGYYGVDLPQYFVSLFYFDALPLLFMTVLSFFIQSVSPNKYIGMLAFIIFMLVTALLGELGLEHHMYRYAEAPGLVYSDMNEYGWSLETQQKYMTYWGALALLFATISFAIWRRGNQTTLRHRFKILPQTLGQGGRLLIVCCIGLFLSMGVVINYNTTVTNKYVSSSVLNLNKAEYEKAYSTYEYLPVTDIIKTDLNIALFPSQRKLQLIADLTLRNNTDEPIERILVNLPDHSHSIRFDASRGQIKAESTELQTAWLEFDTPLRPLETFTLNIALMRQHFGFKDTGEDFSLVKNGSLIDNKSLLPTFGVNIDYYLHDSVERRSFGLAERSRLKDASHKYASNRSFITKDGALTELKVYVSTDIDQVALAPGIMVDYWQANNRNHFVYETRSPVNNFFNIVSADWQVYARRFLGIDLSIHYHPPHHWNTDSIMQAMQTSLTAFSDRFGEYPFAQLRIVEIPRYRATMTGASGIIAFSESFGFIADLRDDNKIDTVLFATAYELSKQWFSHKINIADVQGAEVLTKSLAQYAALSLMQDTFGRVNLRNFMRYELTNYLRGRAVEQRQENPLAQTQYQSYLANNKGALVLMAIASRIGFDNVDNAINSLMSTFSSASDQYATVDDFIDVLKVNAMQRDHAFIDEQFYSITLYDLRLENIEKKMIDERQQIVLTVFANHMRLNDDGSQEKLSFNDEVEVVFFSDSPNDFTLENSILFSDTVKLTDGIQEIILNTELSPAYIAVDPFLTFIEREIRDNVKAVK